MGLRWKIILDFIWTKTLGRKTHKDEQKVQLFIEWDPSLSVNRQDIDQQYQILIKIINDLYAMVISEKSMDRETIASLISSLKTYTAFHFSVEESYFEKFGYPEAEQHKK